MFEEELENILSNNEKEESSKNIPHIQKENKYEKNFEMTEKLLDQSKYITDFLYNNNIIGRKYLGKTKKLNILKYLLILN